MKTGNFVSGLLDSLYNAVLAVISISFIITLVSFLIPMPSVMISVIHVIMLAGLCLAVPSALIIIHRYTAFIRTGKVL